MGGLFFVLGILMIVFSITFGIVWDSWWYPKTYEYALKLADDASLPEQKAGYLKDYYEKVKYITKDPAYVFMTPDKKLSTQKVIIEGLIKRFEDIAALSPSEMAYQTGMQQLTGQEMDHQLSSIRNLFRSAKMREDPFVFFIMAWMWLVGGVMTYVGYLNLND